MTLEQITNTPRTCQTIMPKAAQYAIRAHSAISTYPGGDMADDERETWQEHRIAVLRTLDILQAGSVDVKSSIADLHRKIDHVLQTEIQRMDADHAALRVEVAQRFGSVDAQLAGLNVKAGAWGLIAGLIPAAIAVIFYLLKH